LRDPKRLGAWLRAIAIHRCIDQLRHTQPELSIRDDARAVPSHEPSPYDKVAAKELRERLKNEIAALPRKQRAAMSLYYFEGHSTNDIARMLGVPAGSIRRRLHDGRSRLRKKCRDLLETDQ